MAERHSCVYCSAASPISDSVRLTGEWSEGWIVNFRVDLSLCFPYLQLIYNSFAQFLVQEKGYDKELLTLTPEDWDFW